MEIPNFERGLGSQKSWRVLIIEDDPTVGLMLQTSLSYRYGCQVYQACTSQEALAILPTFIPDVILCDVMMPNTDGFELCKILKASSEFRDIPLIFISACEETWVMEKAFELGANDYIQKPFQLNDIMQSISRLHAPYRYS